MRTIKFRGKEFETNECVYGSLVKDNFKDRYFIGVDGDPILSQVDFVEVDKETIGQFTGLYDKNGNEIYEGDILSLKDEVGKKGIVTVGFEDGGFIVFKGLAYRYIGVYHNIGNELEIIGNIHDNKEI